MSEKDENEMREKIKNKEKELDKLKELYFGLKLKRIESEQKRDV